MPPTAAAKRSLRAYFADAIVAGDLPRRIDDRVARARGYENADGMWQYLAFLRDQEQADQRAAQRATTRQRRLDVQNTYVTATFTVRFRDYRADEVEGFPERLAVREFQTSETFFNASADAVRAELQKRVAGPIVGIERVVVGQPRPIPANHTASMTVDFAYFINDPTNRPNSVSITDNDIVATSQDGLKTFGVLRGGFYIALTPPTDAQTNAAQFDMPVERYKKMGLGRRLAYLKKHYLERYNSQYDERYKTVLGAPINIVELQARNLADVPMRLAMAFHIDGAEDQPWHKAEGTCVVDFLAWRYGERRGMKKVANRDALMQRFDLLNDNEDDDDDLEPYSAQEHDALLASGRYVWKKDGWVKPAVRGITTGDIERCFCRPLNIPMYALDQHSRVFHKFMPEKPNTNCPSLCFKVFDNHMYPICDPDAVNGITKVVRVAAAKNGEIERSDNPKKNVPVEVIEYTQGDNTLDLFLKRCTDEQTYPAQSFDRMAFSFDGQGVRNFKLKDKRVILARDVELCKTICKRMETEYTGQGIGELLIDMMGDLPQSHMNPEMLAMFVHPGQKRRMHHGFFNGATATKKDELQCWDIVKAYSYCLVNALQDWGVFDFNDTWEECTFDQKFDGEVAAGYYIVKTSDRTLFVGDGIYSAPLVRKAVAEGIRFSSTHKMVPSSWVPKEKLIALVDRIKTLSDGDPGVMKALNCRISGMFGKTQVKRWTACVTRSMDDVLAKFSMYTHTPNQKPFIIKRDVDDKTFWLYGYQSTVDMTENNMPWYIQITDQANIMLFDLVKAAGGFDRLVYRNTDCAVMRDGELPEGLIGAEWGQVKASKLPHWTHSTYLDAPTKVPEWRRTLAYNDSDQAAAIAKAIIANGGGLLMGRAGTGKTYVAKAFRDALEAAGQRAAVCAFTNKAALVAGGKTIHRLLTLDKAAKMSVKTAHALKREFDWVIVDEISMISKTLWARLAFLKQTTGMKLLLVGDHRQCAPVDPTEDKRHYFDHGVVRYLANSMRCELTARKRYDKALWDELELVWAEKSIDLAQYAPKEVTDVNLCFINETRVRVNEQLMRLRAPVDAVELPCNPKDELSQKVWLFAGLPVLARKTAGGGNALVNNEAWVVERVEEGVVNLRSKARDLTFECKVADFQATFLPAYAVTIHKAQGETIEEPFTIHDWTHMMFDRRLKYTAMSRARTCGQIQIDAKKPAGDWALNRTIAHKIASHAAVDAGRGIKCDLDVKYIRSLMRRQGMVCAKQCCAGCDGTMLTTWLNPHEPRQFSIDRINTERGHVKGNVQMVCFGCNSGSSLHTI